MLTAGWSEFSARNALLLLMVLFEKIHLGNRCSQSKSAYITHVPAKLKTIPQIAPEFAALPWLIHTALSLQSPPDHRANLAVY